MYRVQVDQSGLIGKTSIKTVLAFSDLTIDMEFTGLEGHIKGMLLRYIRRIDPSFSRDKITFRRIGKGSTAHLKAIETYRENLKPERVVTQEGFLALL